ncbi:MAG: hypothetical protein IH600_13385 [Bacteroidetes bacterium]|nr:hypothetical protein [Bacteroidota bacterium]
MKTIHTILIVLLTIAGMSVLRAQPNNDAIEGVPGLGITRIDRLAEAEANYTAGLSSENNGLVESSLYYALHLRIAYPEQEFAALETAIDDLVKDGRTHCIRYKASLASTVFSSPRLIDPKLATATNDMNGFFTMVAKQLEQKLLVSKD